MFEDMITVSRNNVFRNFVSTEDRAAGALTVLKNGPFMLDTENRLLNLTFENANEIYLQIFNSGGRGRDSPYGCNLLDLDGTTTGMSPGGWIVSDGAPHMLNDNCILKPEWNAWICPVFPGGYGQILVTNDNGLPSNTGSNGVDYSVSEGEQIVRAHFHQMGSEEYGAVSGATSNGNFQLMANIKVNTAYTVRFKIGEFDAATPSSLLYNLHSVSPGQYIIMSVPYPVSARPFRYEFIISGRTWDYTDREVNSLDQVDETHWFYDTNTEHLYFMIVSVATSGTLSNRTNKEWKIADYSPGSQFRRIVAEGCEEECSTTKLDIPDDATQLISLEFRYEQFEANLEPCQLKLYGNDAKGNGKAFFTFFPSSKILQFDIYHNLNANSNGIFLGLGEPGFDTEKILTKEFATFNGPIRGFWGLSVQQWEYLVQGKLFITITTEDQPEGAIKGQIGCSDTCTDTYPVVVNYPVCNVSEDDYLKLYPDSGGNWGTGTYLNDNFDSHFTGDSVCGNESLRIGMRYTYQRLIISWSGGIIDSNVYKNLEFFAKTEEGSGEAHLQVQCGNCSSFWACPIQKIYLKGHHISNYVIDESEWVRVRVSLEELGFVGEQEIFGCEFILAGEILEDKFMYFDEIRFTKEDSDQTELITRDVEYFDPDLCSNTPELVSKETSDSNEVVTVTETIVVSNSNGETETVEVSKTKSVECSQNSDCISGICLESRQCFEDPTVSNGSFLVVSSVISFVFLLLQ